MTAPPIILFGAGPLDLGAGSATGAPGLGNRLWHFASQALRAGYPGVLLLIEPDAPPQLALRERIHAGLAWREARVSPPLCKNPAALSQMLAAALAPQRPALYVGAGTLLASATACAVAGDQPVWADLFGDPLAEIAAKAEVVGTQFTADEYFDVWRLLQTVLARADAFSTVTRRQAEGLAAQLLLAGREERLGLPRLAERIHPMPCAVESLDFCLPMPPAERAALRTRYGLPADARVALWSGGFNAWADPETLVHGLQLAIARDPSLHLVATGADLPGYLGTVYERFRACAAASPCAAQIHALGWVPRAEADAWLCAADVAVMVDRPCAETQFGARNRLLYHAAAACPIVASRGTEVVLDLHHAGALLAFDPGNAPALADALSAALAGGPRIAQLTEAALAYGDRNYRFATTTQAFLNFLATPQRDPALATPHPGPAWLRQFLNFEAHEHHMAELHSLRTASLPQLLKRWLRR